MSEQWRPIAGYEGRYEVSSLGGVRSLPRMTGNGKGRRLFRGGVIYQHINKLGYAQVVLWIGKIGTSRKVHSLVAEAFIGPRLPDMQVCHSNGNSRDNSAANLRYGTAQENMDDRARHGKSPVGTRNGMAKLSVADVLAIRKSTVDNVKLAAVYGVTDASIGNVKRGATWKCIPRS